MMLRAKFQQKCADISSKSDYVFTKKTFFPRSLPKNVPDEAFKQESSGCRKSSLQLSTFELKDPKTTCFEEVRTPRSTNALPRLRLSVPASTSPQARQPAQFRKGQAYPIFKTRIFFSIEVPSSTCDFVSFTTDEVYIYIPFCDDFGPLNLGSVFRFCVEMKDLLSKSTKPLLLHTKNDPHYSNNAAFLLAAFLVMELNMSADEAWTPFAELQPTPFTPYHDATYGPTESTISILDCLRGLAKAKSVGLIRFQESLENGGFDLKQYEHYDDPMNGDLHVVVPGKFVAFKGPTTAVADGDLWTQDDHVMTFHPKFYCPIFASLGVTTVVRLNETHYDGGIFSSEGLAFHELYFDDCTNPPPHVMLLFFKMCDDARDGLIAVHCKAGLGRTGTLIALWLMKEHRFTALEAVGWLRIVRPGSVLGRQQQYLVDMQDKMWRLGALPPAKQSALFNRAAALISAKRRGPGCNDNVGGGDGSDCGDTAARRRARHGSEVDYVLSEGGSLLSAHMADLVASAMHSRARRRIGSSDKVGLLWRSEGNLIGRSFSRLSNPTRPATVAPPSR